MMFLTGLILLGMALGCNRTFDPLSPESQLIFPNESGKYRIYQVIDTLYETSSPKSWGGEDQTYLKKEISQGTETDLLGREVARLEVLTSPDTLDNVGNYIYNFTFEQLWTQYQGNQFGERTEGNVRYLALKFPVYPGLTWDGNLFNAEDSQTYTYLNTDTTVTILGKTYPHCVMVLQQPFHEPVPRGGPLYIEKFAYEIYAPHVGKIKKYTKNIEIQNYTIQKESRVYQELLIEHN
ncbi:MAG: hypothetical protein H6581_10110 [Bacteroidia bacterium]|nr:hypothetical protein [Bacteroidia bacterium]